MTFSAETRERAREIIARYPAGRARSALLPLLHLVQSEQGYVTPQGIAFCAEILGITKAQVGAVATFYTMYKRRPTGDWLVSVCTNTMCGVLGGDKVYEALQRAPRRRPRRDHADGNITLEHAECLAACDYAPVVTVNYEFFDNMTAEASARPGQGSCRTASARSPPAARGCARSRRCRCSWPASPTSATRRVGDGPAGASRRSPATGSPSGTASRSPASTRTPRSASATTRPQEKPATAPKPGLRRASRPATARMPQKERRQVTSPAVAGGARQARRRSSPSAGCPRTRGSSTSTSGSTGTPRCARRSRRTRTT